MSTATATSVKNKGLTGWHVLFMLLGFFGVMIAVNAYFLVAAVTSFRGEDVPRSYRQGLEYNQTIAARETQTAMGWTAEVNVTGKQLVINIQDRNGYNVKGLQIDAKLRHPVDTALDVPLTFTFSGGAYSAEIPPLQGQWKLTGTASNGTAPFTFEYDL